MYSFHPSPQLLGAYSFCNISRATKKITLVLLSGQCAKSYSYSPVQSSDILTYSQHVIRAGLNYLISLWNKSEVLLVTSVSKTGIAVIHFATFLWRKKV